MITPKFLTFHRQFVTSFTRSVSTSTTIASQRRRRLTATSRGSESSSPRFPHLDILSPRQSYTPRETILFRELFPMYFGSDFSLEEFVIEAHLSAVFVANCIAEGDLNRVRHLVTSEAIEEIGRIFRAFSPDERRLLVVSEEDVYVSFVSSVNASEKHAEIMWVGHVFPNWGDVVSEHNKNIFEVMKQIDARGGPAIVLNYQFIRELTSNVENTWRINALNHFFVKK